MPNKKSYIFKFQEKQLLKIAVLISGMLQIFTPTTQKFNKSTYYSLQFDEKKHHVNIPNIK